MKKYYTCPIEDDFGEGSIAEIYTNFKDRIGYEGRARLLKCLDDDAEDLTYRYFIIAEIGSSKKQSPHTLVWSYKKWRIQFIDGPNKGWITSRKIAFYISTTSKIKI